MIPATARDAIVEAASASAEGRLPFKDIVALLLQAGVESYHVDLRAGTATYYTVQDGAMALDLALPETPIAQGFDTAAIQAAIRGAQQGVVQYPEFKRRAGAAGCVGYTAWLTGRQVSYFGRRGEVHVERFPS